MSRPVNFQGDLGEGEAEAAASGGGRASSASWLARFRAVHPACTSRDYDPKFGPVFQTGRGARLWDVDGLEYLDMTCGYSAANFGHAFEPLVSAAMGQLKELTHVTGEPHVGRIQLAERLLEVLQLPSGQFKVIFNVTGARAIEAAWKAARAFRPGMLLTIGPSYHGRSIATLALSSHMPLENRRQGTDFIRPELLRSWPRETYPYCSACALKLKYPSCRLACAQDLIQFLKTQSEQVSAVLVEPAIGAKGYIFPPSDFFQRLRAITQEKNILLIADEIQTGLGRCGDWLLSRRQGWQADLTVLGKSLGGGIAPISAVIGRADVLDSLQPGTESETFSGSPLATAVGLQVLELLQHGGWMQHGEQIGLELREFASQTLNDLQLSICSIEGQGACCVIEFCDHRLDAQRPSQSLCQEQALRLAQACIRERLLVHYTGPHHSRIVLLPPLTLGVQEKTDLQDRLRRSLMQLAGAD